MSKIQTQGIPQSLQLSAINSASVKSRPHRSSTLRKHEDGKPDHVDGTAVVSEHASEKSEEGVNVVVLTEVNRFHAGQMFGQLAIINPNAGRACSVKCLNSCSFVVLTSRDYNRYLRRVIEKVEDAKITLLKQTPLF